MTLIVSALGLFYVVMALFVLRRARAQWIVGQPPMGQAFSKQPDRRSLYFMTTSAGLYGVAGVALLAKSHMAVWLLGCGLLVQAAYYGLEWLTGRWQPEGAVDQVLGAMIISAGAFAFAAYAARLGVLT